MVGSACIWRRNGGTTATPGVPKLRGGQQKGQHGRAGGRELGGGWFGAGAGRGCDHRGHPFTRATGGECLSLLAMSVGLGPPCAHGLRVQPNLLGRRALYHCDGTQRRVRGERTRRSERRPRRARARARCVAPERRACRSIDRRAILRLGGGRGTERAARHRSWPGRASRRRAGARMGVPDRGQARARDCPARTGPPRVRRAPTVAREG
jgi:hypothetical protein